MKKERKRERKGRKNWKVVGIFLLVLFILSVVCILYFEKQNENFEVTYYTIHSHKVQDSVRAVVLSDLHSNEYGENNAELIQRIGQLKPDLILMIGDMINRKNTDLPGLIKLCEKLQEFAPIFFTSGNHESEVMNAGLNSIPVSEKLKKAGVEVLTNSNKTFVKDNTVIQIIGIPTNPENYDKWSKAKVDKYIESNDFKILMSHYPSLYEEKLKDLEVDLALAGHYHGGLIRIPGIGGLYHPQGGFFPKYSGGIYQLTHAKLVVSRGIGSHGFIPRMNNVPELVVIDIKEP